MIASALGVAAPDPGAYPARKSEPQQRPPETSLTMALRSVTAAVVLSHRHLPDANFLGMLLALQELAKVLNATYYMDRQVLRACRDDAALVGRLDAWLWKAGVGDDCEAAELRAQETVAPQVAELLQSLYRTREAG